MERFTVELSPERAAVIVASVVRGDGDALAPNLAVEVWDRASAQEARRGYATRAEGERVRATAAWADAVAAAERLAAAATAERAERRRQEAAAQAELDAIRAEAEATGTRIVVRFGRAPKGGRSWNYRDNRPEAGVSAYHAWLLPDGAVVVDMGACDAVSGQFVTAGRDLYRLWGDVVGTGSDGEPVLAVTRSRRLAAAGVRFC